MHNAAFVPTFFVKQKQYNEAQTSMRHCLRLVVWAQGNNDTDKFLEREFIDY